MISVELLCSSKLAAFLLLVRQQGVCLGKIPLDSNVPMVHKRLQMRKQSGMFYLVYSIVMTPHVGMGRLVNYPTPGVYPVLVLDRVALLLARIVRLPLLLACGSISPAPTRQS